MLCICVDVSVVRDKSAFDSAESDELQCKADKCRQHLPSENILKSKAKISIYLFEFDYIKKIQIFSEFIQRLIACTTVQVNLVDFELFLIPQKAYPKCQPKGL